MRELQQDRLELVHAVCSNFRSAEVGLFCRCLLNRNTWSAIEVTDLCSRMSCRRLNCRQRNLPAVNVFYCVIRYAFSTTPNAAGLYGYYNTLMAQLAVIYHESSPFQAEELQSLAQQYLSPQYAISHIAKALLALMKKGEGRKRFFPTFAQTLTK